MPRRLLALALALLTALPATAQDDPAAAIRGTIQGQIDAFLADDVATAFSFAAPGIQGIFQTPENFGRMVREGYPMVWRPAEVTFLDLHPRDGGLWQRVRITDAEGRVHFLDYQMLTTPDGIRIGAVELLRMPEVGA